MAGCVVVLTLHAAAVSRPRSGRMIPLVGWGARYSPLLPIGLFPPDLCGYSDASPVHFGYAHGHTLADITVHETAVCCSWPRTASCCAACPTCTVEDVVRDWLGNGLGKAEESTRKKNQHLAETHIVPLLGARRLRELTVADVDKWLAGRAKVVSTSTLRMIHSVLNRSIKRAMAQDKVKRNVVELATLRKGREGRQSKSLTLAQAAAILDAVEGTRMQA